jgi:GntP family gluconate:H+ symporter
MLVGSWADLVFAPKSLPNNLLRFAGNSDVALLIAVLVSFFTFGKLQGFNRDQILEVLQRVSRRSPASR